VYLVYTIQSAAVPCKIWQNPHPHLFLKESQKLTAILSISLLKLSLSCNGHTSATTLVSIRNTRVFRTALTALTEPLTLWRRIPRYLSPRRRVALHPYLLHFVAMLTHHQKDTCVTLFAGAAFMLKPFTQRLAMLNHSYYLSFNDYQILCIQFVFSSTYLYSYLSTHGISGLAARGDCQQFEVHLQITIKWTQRYTPRPGSSGFGDALGGPDGENSEMHWEAVIERVGDALRDWDWVNSQMHLEAMIERVWRCTWRPRLSELRDALWGRDRASLEMHLEAEVEWTQRCTLRPWSSKFGNAIGDWDWLNSQIHSEAVIERVWRCTRSRLWSSEIAGVLGGGRSGGGRWEVRQVLRLYSSVS